VEVRAVGVGQGSEVPVEAVVGHVESIDGAASVLECPVVDETRVTAGGVSFGVLTEGPSDGPLALLLHGFPDSAWTWRFLAPVLAEAGFRVAAPFLRGYAPTEVPADGFFQTGALVRDAVALHGALGGDERAVIVGHDWGASATYGAAAFAPSLWSRVVTMAVPPASALAGGFTTYDQLRRSWYMFFFQHPLSDMVVPMDDLRFLDRLWADWSPGYDAAEDLERVKASLRDPSNLAAALGYYRATLGAGLQSPDLAGEQAATSLPTPQPLLYLHGRDDGCIGVEVASAVPDARIVDGAGHFLHLEQPDAVNGLIVDFLTS
jgi:pimeloyl-ACP methyl ester carboxylesterase